MIISGFDLPVNVTGKIKMPKTVGAVNLHEGPEIKNRKWWRLIQLTSRHSESSDYMLFFCSKVGCVIRFATLNWLENHLLIAIYIYRKAFLTVATGNNLTLVGQVVKWSGIYNQKINQHQQMGLKMNFL